MKNAKLSVLLITTIILGSFFIYEKNTEKEVYLSNSLLLANVEALTQGESGGGSVDSVELVTFSESSREIQNWTCDLPSGIDFKKIAVDITRNCHGTGGIPCSVGTWTDRTEIEERRCRHQQQVR